jgi:hypothetical protein
LAFEALLPLAAREIIVVFKTLCKPPKLANPHLQQQPRSEKTAKIVVLTKHTPKVVILFNI